VSTSKNGSAIFRVCLVAAVVAMGVIAWHASTNSANELSVAMPNGGKEHPQPLATSAHENQLRAPPPQSEGSQLIVDAKETEQSAPEEPVLDEEAWRKSYANASVGQLLAASAALRAEVEEKSGPIIDSMHAAGHSEYLGPETVYEGRPNDNEAIFRVYMEQNKGTYRMELPRTHYPELYTLKARALWLEELARKKKQS